jgi:N-acetylmuramoyl-L-alanine amidase
MTPYRITIHCSATQNGKEYPIEQLRRDHIARGFQDIGYHMVIGADGQCYDTRPLNQIGAHVKDENKGNVGICLVGTDKFSQKQFDVLRYKLDSVIMIYNIKPWEIWAHNQFKSAIAQGKVCPSISINTLLAWYIGHRNDALEPYLLK